MEMTSESRNDVLWIKTREPRLDAAVAIQFKDRMRELTESASERVILDMSSVDFMDSSGLGALVAAMKQRGAGNTLELSGLTEPVRKVFHLTRMDSVFVIHEDAVDAPGAGRAAAP